MADIYTDITNGDDSTGDGSVGTPYETIQKALDEANGGDTVWIGDSATNTLASQLNWTLFGTVQDTGVDARLCVRGWSYSGGAGADGIAVIDGNSLAGILAATKNYVTWYHLDVSGTDGASHSCLELGTTNVCMECRVSDVTGASSLAIKGTASYCQVINCRCENVVRGIAMTVGGSIIGCTITGNSDYAMNITAAGVCYGNTVVSGGGNGAYPTQDGVIISHNRFIGDGSTASRYGINVGATAEGLVITNNQIQGWSGTSNIGVNNPSGNSIAVLGGNYYANNTADESASISDDVDVYLSAAGPGQGIVVNVTASDSAPTAAEVADAVLEEAVADHSGTAGSLAERMTRIPDVAPDAEGGLLVIGSVVGSLDEIAGAAFAEEDHALDTLLDETEVEAKVNDALVALGLDHFVSAAMTGADVADDSFAAQLVSASGTADWDDYDNTAESSQALRDRGDAAWITAAGFATAVVCTEGRLSELDAGNLPTDIAAVPTTSEMGDALYGDSRYDKYAALIELDTSGDTDDYTVRFLENGEAITSGITSPTITVLQRSDGSTLVDGETLTEVSDGWYTYDESDNQLPAGDTALIDVSATYDGGAIAGQRPILKYET